MQIALVRAVNSVGLAVVISVAASASVFDLPPGQTSLQFVTVVDPGNAPDTLVMDDHTSGYGAVSYTYQIGRHEVTAAQYCAFLNSVAALDPYGLYHPNMASVGSPNFGCGIQRSGSPGSYRYALTNNPDLPANWLAWGDAARFCNWLQNGQQDDPSTTERGSYTLDGATSGSALIALTRNADAKYVIPSEDEWYKAAYYKGGGTSAGYWLYPTRSDTRPSNEFSATGTNNANYDGTAYPLGITPVGAFAASPGPYGTFDQAGNLWEYNEAIINGTARGARGGTWTGIASTLIASNRGGGYAVPTYESMIEGFRVAVVPEPSGSVLLIAATCFSLRRRVGR
jgi:formylglycine-generating enzyme required for sulfatase activity